MASTKHVHSMTSSVTYSRAHKKKPIRRRRRSTYSTSSEDMGDASQRADPRTVRERRLRYYQEAEDRRKREERDGAVWERRRDDDAQNARSRDGKASSRTRSHESHRHRRSSNPRSNKASSTYDDDKGKRRHDSLERVVIRRTIVEEPRGSFIGSHLKELRSPPVARKASPRDSEAGPSYRGLENNSNIGRGASVQERSDRHVAAAASIAESVRRRGTTATRDRPAGKNSPRSAGEEKLAAEDDSVTLVATPSIAPSVTTQTTTDTKRRASKPPPSVLGTIFGAPTPAAKQPEALITCLTCADDETPRSKAAKLACSHYMCHDCLKRVFTMSITDPAHMPPKCCTVDHIPLKHVEKLFDTKFKIKWNKKYQEYTTKNRLYCPVRGCGEWIKPASITTDSHGRKYGKCSRCKTKVCATCNGKYHVSKDCPKDEATKAFAEIAKKEGWRRCPNCTAMVERKSGCNHIICRCKASWCILCGSKWKTCNCPQFNDEVIEQIRQEELRNPFGFALPPEEFERNPEAGMPFREQVRRQQERERRDQERQDRDLARQLGAMDFLDPGQDPRADMNMLGAALVDAIARPRQGERPRHPAIHVRPPYAIDGYARPPRRHHAAGGTDRHASDHESQGGRSRAGRAERVVVRREARDYRTEAEMHRPITIRASHADLRSGRGTRARRSAAAMAGL